MSKQYGLILPNKNKGHQIAPVSSKKPSIFNDDSDSDTPQSVKPTGFTKTVKKQDKLNQARAIEEDPTVYQYDEIYDDMDQKRKESKLSRKDLDKKPKYINRLLAAAEKRKRENERRIERQVQKEREEEGEQFKDKESFVTSAYKKKLEEMREQEELEKREEYLESIGDVRKQGNLDGFYRHLYDQKVNYEDTGNEVEVKKEIKEESKSDSASDKEESSPKRRKSSESHSDSGDKIKPKKAAKARKYRIRRNSAEEKSDEETNMKKEHLPSNLDADSDFSIDSSDSEDEKKEEEKKEPEDCSATTEQKDNEKQQETKDDIKENVNEKSDTDKDTVEVKVEEVKPKKPKVDIWKKRTVGVKFDEAVKRYYERKAAREAGL